MALVQLYKDWLLLTCVDAPAHHPPVQSKAVLAGLLWPWESHRYSKQVSEAGDHRPPAGLWLFRAYSRFGRDCGFPLFPNNLKARGCLLLAPPLPRDSYLSKMLSAHRSAWTSLLSFWKCFAPSPLHPCASWPSDRHSSLAAKSKAWQQKVPEAMF